MKKIFLPVLALAVFAFLSVSGCAQKAADSQQAIEQSKAMTTVDAKVKYLVGQANAFINSKDFDQAIKTAQYVLSNLDQNSADAKNVLAKAQAELKKKAQTAMGDMKNKLGIK